MRSTDPAVRLRLLIFLATALAFWSWRSVQPITGPITGNLPFSSETSSAPTRGLLGPESLPDAGALLRQQIFYSTIVPWILGIVATLLMLGLAAVLYYLHPQWLRWRYALVPLPTTGLGAKAGALVLEIWQAAHLAGIPRLLLEPTSAAPSVWVFGSGGKYHMVMNLGAMQDTRLLASLAQSALARVRRGDVRRQYQASALGLAFVLLLVVPWTVLSISLATGQLVMKPSIYGLGAILDAIRWLFVGWLIYGFLGAAWRRSLSLYADVRRWSWFPEPAIGRALFRHIDRKSFPGRNSELIPAVLVGLVVGILHAALAPFIEDMWAITQFLGWTDSALLNLVLLLAVAMFLALAVTSTLGLEISLRENSGRWGPTVGRGREWLFLALVTALGAIAGRLLLPGWLHLPAPDWGDVAWPLFLALSLMAWLAYSHMGITTGCGLAGNGGTGNSLAGNGGAVWQRFVASGTLFLGLALFSYELALRLFPVLGVALLVAILLAGLFVALFSTLTALRLRNQYHRRPR
ncbi:MAG: hypothetical protein HY326_09875 [Chloroflexi bacterium]|nr:hypothetical protein [Chloroflexota bacterium]